MCHWTMAVYGREQPMPFTRTRQHGKRTRFRDKPYARAVQALYCADPLITALLASGAQHYLEFKLVQARYVAGR